MRGAPALWGLGKPARPVRPITLPHAAREEGWERRHVPTAAARQTPRARSQSKHVQHGGIALLVEFRRIGPPALATRRVRSRRDCHILLAVDLKGHGRRREGRADIDLPHFVERGVVRGRDGAIRPAKTRPRPRGQHAGKVRVRQVEVLLDLLGHRIDGREVTFHAPDRGGVAAIPAALAIVLGPIDLDIMAAGQGWDVDELGPRTVKNLANNCCRPGWTGRPA